VQACHFFSNNSIVRQLLAHKNMPGTLYLIPNTLGNLNTDDSSQLTHIIPDEVQGITATLDYFIAENAKTARAFLKLVAVNHPLCKPIQEIRIEELNINSDSAILPMLLAPLLAGQNAGLISEAGVPAVADPGANLVGLAHDSGIAVKPLVGPSSLLLAIMASGLNGQSFAFNGYLPVDASQRTKRIRALEERSRAEKQTQLFIETPYRNTALLEALIAQCHSTTRICVATDLTLETESIKTQTASRWKTDLASNKLPNFHKKPTVFLFLAQ
jgi:16S rRNA (cytidine1402-2'-O)-methyltransferase